MTMTAGPEPVTYTRLATPSSVISRRAKSSSGSSSLMRRGDMGSLTSGHRRLGPIRTGIRPQRACAARGIPRRDAAADEAGVEAPLDERLRHVAPDVEAVRAVNGHWLVRPQLADPLLDAIRIAP